MKTLLYIFNVVFWTNVLIGAIWNTIFNYYLPTSGSRIINIIKGKKEAVWLTKWHLTVFLFMYFGHLYRILQSQIRVKSILKLTVHQLRVLDSIPFEKQEEILKFIRDALNRKS